MSVAWKLFKQLIDAGEDEKRARLFADAFDQL